MTSPFDFETRGYTKNTYIADPDEWVTLFQMPGDGVHPYWRIVIPTDNDTPEDVLAAPDRVQAWLQDRNFVTPDDVRAVVHPVLRHRLILSYDANAENISADAVVDRLIEKVAVPA